MSNHISQLLTNWSSKKNEFDWVLGTVIETQGSSYRKAGAMMLINSMGQFFGLVSGGCLESDVMRNARQVIQSKTAKIIQYDMREENDFAWTLGIGCGGMVRILLQSINEENQYLHLDALGSALASRQPCWYLQQIVSENSVLTTQNQLVTDQHSQQLADLKISKMQLLQVKKSQWIDSTLVSRMLPVIHLLVFGGGIDAQPVISIASDMGWKVTLVDHRSGYARQTYFPKAQVINDTAESLPEQLLQSVDAIVAMGHNITFDAEAMKVAQQSSAKYVGLLGPTHRKKIVFDEAGLTESELSIAVDGPMGIDIGGEVPEAIALSVVAGIHANMEKLLLIPASTET